LFTKISIIYYIALQEQHLFVALQQQQQQNNNTNDIPFPTAPNG
jgi:hypothetical protein